MGEPQCVGGGGGAGLNQNYPARTSLNPQPKAVNPKSYPDLIMAYLAGIVGSKALSKGIWGGLGKPYNLPCTTIFWS